MERAFHAMAIDEDRKVFQPTLMQQKPENSGQKLRKEWFPGTHVCLGGGAKAYRGLSNGALLWAIDVIQNDFKLGLEFDLTKIEDGSKVDPLINFTTVRDATGFSKFIWQFTGIISRNIEKSDRDPIFHNSVKQRWQGRSDYRPENLKPFRAQFE
ncbi:DUF2235 domain-containing protein [Spirulina sp. 06S082]|uniref:DUF2235 domain-containing protein n=1 Tax=Spirulina sp. 06S082 TaxID=3110248 RepID=UPI002B21F82A|nr:DUF2235 domain-containing protein [Spirulina sp. 06S082]MEA5471200.1 DUF2235 domain-containing protein [Spirulina sp. 06S082]